MPSSKRRADPFVDITMGMFDMIERYRRENDALREMLLRRGLARPQLRKEMNAILKQPKPHRSADLQFQELRERMRAVLEQNPVTQALLREIPVPGKPQ
jgi:hypothetical protein